MTKPLTDQDYIARHRRVWAGRPDLRAAYHAYFDLLKAAVGDRRPVVELGSGPGFFKEYWPELVTTDIVANPWIDHVCDAWRLPFESGSVGALVMIDVVHHLPKPLDFVAEAARVLRPGGRLALIEPWITPLSFILYRYFHHEDCSFDFTIDEPFGKGDKDAFDGNAVIPYRLFKTDGAFDAFNRITLKPFLGMPYLATLGFKRTTPMPGFIPPFANICETLLTPLRPLGATRVLGVWEKR